METESIKESETETISQIESETTSQYTLMRMKQMHHQLTLGTEIMGNYGL